MGAGSSISEVVQAEIKVIKQVLEKQFSNAASLIGSLGAQAPQITATTSAGFKLAKEEYMEHYEKLDDEARQDADKARVLWKDL
jgi:cytochrome c556